MSETNTTWKRTLVRLEIESADCVASVLVDVSVDRDDNPSEGLVKKTVTGACALFIQSLRAEDVSRSFHYDSDLQSSSPTPETLDNGFALSCEANDCTVMLNSIKTADYRRLPGPTFEIWGGTVIS